MTTLRTIRDFLNKLPDELLDNNMSFTFPSTDEFHPIDRICFAKDLKGDEYDVETSALDDDEVVLVAKW